MVRQPLTPARLYRWLWPDSRLYDKQWEIVRSVWRDDETFVVAGNMLGKDYVAARIALMFFLSREPCRIVATSSKDYHLNVLWGEMNRAIDESPQPLRHEQGGPLIVTRREMRKIYRGKLSRISYLAGMVANPDRVESMGGHHVGDLGDGVPRTLFLADEASGVPDTYYPKVSTWAARKLIFGNAWDSENFFKRAFHGNALTGDPGGDLVDPEDPARYLRKALRIQAIHSPNVRLRLAEEAAGRKPSHRVLFPGVKTFRRYRQELRDLTPELKSIVLNAEWWEGESTKLCPAAWLQAAAQRAVAVKGQRRQAKVIGLDVGEGGDDTVACVADDLGIIELDARKTADTSVIVPWLKSLIQTYGVEPENVFVDLGGGGREHVDRLRSEGLDVQGISFGESARPPREYWSRGRLPEEQREGDEAPRAFKNRRAQMFWLIRQRINPQGGDGWGIPAEYAELHRQLSKIPVKYDQEGRIFLPPKRPRGTTDRTDNLQKLLGRSPDEADATALAAFALEVERYTFTIGAL